LPSEAIYFLGIIKVILFILFFYTKKEENRELFV